MKTTSERKSVGRKSLLREIHFWNHFWKSFFLNDWEQKSFISYILIVNSILLKQWLNKCFIKWSFNYISFYKSLKLHLSQNQILINDIWLYKEAGQQAIDTWLDIWKYICYNYLMTRRHKLEINHIFVLTIKLTLKLPLNLYLEPELKILC